MEKKKCLECEETFAGRVDKKFCSDYCRNAYNNRVNKDGKNLIRNVNNRLRKNWRILEELNPTGKCTVTKQKLAIKDFDFNYITEIYTTKVGKVYHFCYDQGYSALENDLFMLVKKD